MADKMNKIFRAYPFPADWKNPIKNWLEDNQNTYANELDINKWVNDANHHPSLKSAI